MLLKAEGLRVSLPAEGGPHEVLSGVSLTLDTGEVVDVGGPSGAGKTTLLRAIARLLPGVEGDLALDGRDARDVAPHEWRAAVALLPQAPAMLPGSVADNLRAPWALRVRAGAEPPSDQALAEALGRVGLDAVALGRDACRLSLGQRARVAMVRVLLSGPRVLLLDEPDANLDDDSAAQVEAMTLAFADAGGGVVRVRHHRRGQGATRRYRLAGGALTPEVAP